MSIPIRGTSWGTPLYAFDVAVERGARRHDFLLPYLNALYADCATVGLRADVLVSQADLETGAFTSTYWTRDGNPAGLAAFDDGTDWGLTFTPEKAARAHVTHMCRYTGVPVPDGWIATDARWDAAAKYAGTVSTTAHLGNGRWGTDPQYSSKLEARHAAYAFTPPATPAPIPPTEGTDMALTFGNVPRPPIQQRILSNSEAVEGHGWDNLGKRNPKFIALHRMVGTLWGTDGYFRNPAVASLTDFGIGIASVDGVPNAGKILQWNDYKGHRSGWASGPVSGAYGDGLAIVNKYGINAVNRDGISVEISGTDQPLDDTSWRSLVHLCAYLIDEMRIPYTSLPKNPHTGINVLIWHNEFTNGTGKQCPFTWMRNNTNRLYADVAALLKQYQEGAAKPDPVPAPVPVERTVDFLVPMMIRTTPGFWDTKNNKNNVIETLPAGTKGTVIEGPVEADGLEWFHVTIPDFGKGWVAKAIINAIQVK